jgi:hypothetical protein
VGDLVIGPKAWLPADARAALRGVDGTGRRLGVVLAVGLPRSGAVGVIALAAYTVVRQGILGFRDEPRHWRYGRAVTASLAAAALIAGVVVLVAG